MADKFSHADLDCGTGGDDSSHDESHAVHFAQRTLLNLSVDLVSSGLGSGDVLGQRMPRLDAVVGVVLECAACQERLGLPRPGGWVCPHAWVDYWPC